MTYVPHFPCTIHWSMPHTVFSEEAAEKQVGQTMMFCGTKVVITKAWVEAGDMFLTLDKQCPTSKYGVSVCICMEHDPDGANFRASRKEETNDSDDDGRQGVDGFDAWAGQARDGALRNLSGSSGD